jgi:glutathione S-transferase
MSEIAALPAFQPLVVISVLLALKMVAVAFVTAKARFDSKVVLNPEDAPVNPGAQARREEADSTLRAKRAHLNDVENIPVFMILALLFTFTGCSATAGWAYFGVYFVARTLHTIFYLRAVQPWRTAAFAIGQLTQLGIIVQLLMRVL